MATKLKTHGVTAETTKSLMLGAGTFYKNLKWDESASDWVHDGVLGATNGGGTLTITPEYFQPELDGVTVKVRGLNFKISEEATIEVNMTEFTEELLTKTLHMKEDTSVSIPEYRKYVSTRQIVDDDYLESIAFVGTLVDQRQVVIILPNAISLSALELSPQDSENATYAVTFTCTASLNEDNLNTLAYEIYYPQGETTAPFV